MKVSTGLAAFAFAATLADGAFAQMSNRPYAFPNTATGGVGMSEAGRQAVLNDRFFGETPNVLIRDAGGSLVDVRKGPNSTAIVSTPDGQFVPGFRGRSFRDGSAGMTVGVFNAFFTPNRRGASRYLPTRVSSDESVTVWTARVVSDSAFVGGRGSVDVWTGLVFGM